MDNTSPAVYVLLDDAITGGTEILLSSNPELVMMRSSAVGIVPKIGKVMLAMGPPCGQPTTLVVVDVANHSLASIPLWCLVLLIGTVAKP